MADQKTTATLQTILAQFREDARTNRDLGDRFERLMVEFFRADPLYAALFSDVWMWNDWPGKGQIGDVGIDLVAKDRNTQEYCAIQCKFFLPEHTLSKADIDSFFTALGKPAFSKGLIVSTTDNWGKNAIDALKQTKPVARIGTCSSLRDRLLLTNEMLDESNVAKAWLICYSSSLTDAA